MLTEDTEQLPVTVRRGRMLQVIAEREFVRVADLSETFRISDVTVRGDLAALEVSHGVRRVRGGAMAPSRPPRMEPSFEESLTESAGEKQRIGERAASMVSSGMSVLLDVGTTTSAVARALVAREDLDGVVVVTNGLLTALELEPAVGRFTVVVTGGTLRRRQHSLVDPMVSASLGTLHADLAIVGCSGVDAEHGVTDASLPEAEIKQRIVRAAERTVVVADGRKLGHAHLGRIAALSEVGTVVTGASAPSSEVARLRRLKVDVVQVE